MLDNVTQPVLGINKMIARVEIAIVHDSERRPASLAKDAQYGVEPKKGLLGDVEHLDKAAADVVSHPFVKFSQRNLPYWRGSADQEVSCAG